MGKTIIIAGSTGNLGNRITNQLLKKNLNVITLVRNETDKTKIQALKDKGVEVFQTDMNDINKVSEVCTKGDCFISALSGLRDVIIDTQKNLLEACIKANLPRFIVSDYCLDYTNLIEGNNRNLDLRIEFNKITKDKPIKITSIFNGAFMDLLLSEMPLILNKFNRILYWGDPNVKMDLTTMDNVAEFTANVAIDDDSPRYLKIAGDTISATEVKDVLTEITHKKYKLFRAGSINRLNTIINIAKTFDKSNTELYPAWQGMQYMKDMMQGRAVLQDHDNTRYEGIQWTNVKEFLVSHGY